MRLKEKKKATPEEHNKGRRTKTKIFGGENPKKPASLKIGACRQAMGGNKGEKGVETRQGIFWGELEKPKKKQLGSGGLRQA